MRVATTVCDHSSGMSGYGGIDLGGTKIQAVIVDEDHSVLGSARRPTPTEGGPADVAGEMGRRCATRQGRGAGAGGAEGDRRGSPGTIEDGSVSSARNLPDWEGSSRWRRRSRARSSATVRDRQRCVRWPPTPSSGSAPGARTTRCWASSGARASAVALILDGKPWIGRGGAGEIGHMVVELDGRALHLRAARLHGGVCGAGGDGSARRKRMVEKGHAHGPVQADAGARAHAPDEWHLGAGARARGQARDRTSSSAPCARSAPASPRR